MDMVTELQEQLEDINAEIQLADRYRRWMCARRGAVVRKIMDEIGWKRTARLLGLSRSRLYQMTETSKGNGAHGAPRKTEGTVQ